MEILSSFTNYISSSRVVRPAHLIRFEVPGGGFLYLTDYFRDIVYDNQTFVSGAVKDIGTVKQTKQFNTYDLTIKLSGALDVELSRALNSNLYLNNNLRVYRAYIDDEGYMIPMFSDGSTLIYFEGIISKSSIKDSASIGSAGTSIVTWTCSSEFSDFTRVNGRITDDAAHRGLVAVTGSTTLQPSSSAKKTQYQTDLGFMHANNSVSVLAKYQATETRYRTKVNKTWYGTVSSVRTIEYTVQVPRIVDLRYDLTAQFIPVVYGVRNVTGIPVFVDTLDDDPNTVYVVYTFCEGEIDGFLDFYIGDDAAICWDTLADPDIRVCAGSKKDRGDTINIVANYGVGGASTQHGNTYIVDDGDGPIEFTVYHGTGNQASSGILSDIASNNNFYLQQNPVSEGAAIPAEEYWGTAHQLLDTAYIVCKFNLNEERTEIPDIKADIRGRKVYTYDEFGLPENNNDTSLNPAWQILDYISNSSFGGDIGIDRIDTRSFYKVAQLCDIVDTSYKEEWLKYWRYIGWNTQNASGIENRAMIQCNTDLQTEMTTFKNIDVMLTQIDASLTIANGVYTCTIQADTDPVEDINVDSLIGGDISLSDNSIEGRYNSVMASITDPAKKWSDNQINFYNADYKIADKNEAREGKFKFPFITNYYTARATTERFLKASRSTRTVSFKLPFTYTHLGINDHITLTSERYTWDKKRFMVEELSWTKDTKVAVVAREYIEGMFINSDQVDISGDQVPDISFNVLPVTNLVYTPYLGDSKAGKTAELSWLPSGTGKLSYYTIRYSGLAESIVVQVDPAAAITDRIVLELFNLDVGIYTFSVRAVDYRGKSSKPITLKDVVVDPAKVLNNIEGLSATNASTINPGSWVGPDLLLVWNAYRFNTTEYTNFGYNLVIETNEATPRVLRDIYIPLGTNSFSYTLALNKTDYLSTESSIGINRKLKIKIKAVADGNRTSASWSIL